MQNKVKSRTDSEVVSDLDVLSVRRFMDTLRGHQRFRDGAL